MTRRIGILALSAATGYVSLSQEILWMRVVSYWTGGRPTVFAHVLGVFLVGVAAGALFGERLCARQSPAGSRAVARFPGTMLVVSAMVYYLSMPLVLFLSGISWRFGMIPLFAAVILVAFLLGGIFPVLCHYAASENEAAGVTVSRIYLANIVGSTLGPLFTGFVLMQHFTTEKIILYLSLGTLLVGVIALPIEWSRGIVLRLALTTCVGGMILLSYHRFYDNLLERVQFRRQWVPYKYRLENRSGIIAVTAGKANAADTLYGGGSYDGRFNTDPVNDSNGIKRAYMVAALHPDPHDVLEVGLASGSWTRVLANYAPVRKLTVVEINAGYLDIIAHYPEQASLRQDPKVSIEIDDGRRWLKRNPQERFDLIVQNTTQHWRSNVTNLLSAEYLQLCRSHPRRRRSLLQQHQRRGCGVHSRPRLQVRDAIQAMGGSQRQPLWIFERSQVRANLLKFIRGGKPLFAADDSAKHVCKFSMNSRTRTSATSVPNCWPTGTDG